MRRRYGRQTGVYCSVARGVAGMFLREEAKSGLGDEVPQRGPGIQHRWSLGRSAKKPEITVKNKTEEIDENTQILPFTSSYSLQLLNSKHCSDFTVISLFFYLRPAGTHPCHPLWLRRCRSRIEMRWTGTQLYTRLEKWLDRLDGVVLRTRHANAEVNWIKLKLMDWRVSRAVATSRERSANRVPDHQATPKKQVCLSCLLTSRNVRWPRLAESAR